MRSGRVADYSNRRFRSFRRVRVPTDTVPRHSNEITPYLTLSRLSLVRQIPVVEFVLGASDRRRLVQVRIYDLWFQTFEPSVFVFEVPSTFPGEEVLEADSTT